MLVSCPRNSRYVVAIKMGRRDFGERTPSASEERIRCVRNERATTQTNPFQASPRKKRLTLWTLHRLEAYATLAFRSVERCLKAPAASSTKPKAITNGRWEKWFLSRRGQADSSQSRGSTNNLSSNPLSVASVTSVRCFSGFCVFSPRQPRCPLTPPHRNWTGFS
jgi:hypothetical protein